MGEDRTVAEVEQAYQFQDLQSFLDLYYAGASVLREADDFYQLMMDYLQKCRADNVVHTEIMVEPQTYLPYGVSLDTLMQGFTRAIADAERDWGHAKDYVRMQWMMLQQEAPEDFVIATGVQYSVREFIRWSAAVRVSAA